MSAAKDYWKPCNKGGSYRKWYGNNEYYVYWKDDGHEIKTTLDEKGRIKARLGGVEYSFSKGIEMSRITSGSLSFRISNGGFVYESSTNDIYQVNNEYPLIWLLGYCNSKVVDYFLNLMNPTINIMPEDIRKLPCEKMESNFLNDMVNANIDNSKKDWDSYETSWDFKKHPLICYEEDKVSVAFEMWSKECDERFNLLKVNEEELNRIFIDIYGLQDELTPEVEDKDVTVSKADLQRDIKSLISYAVGCMFGRYSLDEDGLAYAGGEWDNSKYDTFIPDEDNCIPITDEEYFEDDIVGLFCAWLKKVYGEDTLEENLDFIANALGNKGKTSREVIKNYFLTDFIKDHIKTYQKRPIYWLFDSGKQNGFKALVYMHRWNADTIGNVRVEYLHRIQRVYEKEITRMQEIIDNSHDNKEISNATKRKEKLQKQIKETKDYDAKIAHLALSRIDIDLDDGVKVNYEKVQTADGKKMQILAKI